MKGRFENDSKGIEAKEMKERKQQSTKEYLIEFLSQGSLSHSWQYPLSYTPLKFWAVLMKSHLQNETEKCPDFFN